MGQGDINNTDWIGKRPQQQTPTRRTNTTPSPSWLSRADQLTRPVTEPLLKAMTIHDAPNRAVWGGLNSAINTVRGRKSTLDHWNYGQPSKQNPLEWAADPSSGATASELIADQLNYPKNDPTKWELTDIPRAAAWPLDVVTDVNYLTSLGLIATGAAAPAGAALATTTTAKHLNRIGRAFSSLPTPVRTALKTYTDVEPTVLAQKYSLPVIKSGYNLAKKGVENIPFGPIFKNAPTDAYTKRKTTIDKYLTPRSSP